MELKVSSSQPGELSPSDCAADPEEKEFSDDDDDDRNHKHRRRGRSQSLEMDATEQVFSKSYRKRNKPFENGHLFRGTSSQSNEGWKNNVGPLERESFSKFDKRRSGPLLPSRTHLDFNQRIRTNQPFAGDSVLGRGRGRDSWNPRDPRFNSLDGSSQVVNQGPILPSLFPGRGLPNVSNAQSATWNTYGLPRVPNGGLDTLHPLSLQAGLRPSMNPSLSLAIPRQRCRDFEERGFCLRGDICPMEHGVNRIVVEDVQSLSQFNLPVSLSTAQTLGASSGPGSLISATPPSSSLINNRSHSKSSKPGVSDDGFALNGTLPGSDGADFYDPDQPLWNNDGPESPNALLQLHTSHNNESESLLDGDPSSRLPVGLCDDSETGGGVGSHNMSVWGRIRNTKHRTNIKANINSVIKSSDKINHDSTEDQDAVTRRQNTPRQGKRSTGEGIGMNSEDRSPYIQNNATRITRKPSQKAQRTLFVNGVPQKNNKKETLLSHFRKFGEVIDIHIPLNSERAFVQFSRREEAEAALMAPDAVMGNRFIKLWWANRDRVSDDSMSSGNSSLMTPHGTTPASILSHPSITSKGKDNVQASKVSMSGASDVSAPACDQPKLVVPNGSKAPSPNPKKLENLELLKEELRKKQELLDQKRNEFKRKLDKLAKQATGQKNDTPAEQAMKRPKVGAVPNMMKDATPSSSQLDSAVVFPKVEVVADKNKSMEKAIVHGSNSVSALVTQDPLSLKQTIRPSTPVNSLLINRFKLDNRPCAFRIVPPLPVGLTDVSILKEHFSPYGDVSSVELEDLETHGTDKGSDASCGVRVTFTMRRSAESAFLKGKSWQGHNLQFTWLSAKGSSNDQKDEENPPSAQKDPVKPHDGSNVSDEVIVPLNEESEHSNQRADVECNISQEAVVSKNKEPEDSEGRNGNIEQKEPDKDSELSTTPLSSEELPHKDEDMK